MARSLDTHLISERTGYVRLIMTRRLDFGEIGTVFKSRTSASQKCDAVPRRLVFKAPRLVYQSTLGSSVMNKKKKHAEFSVARWQTDLVRPPASCPRMNSSARYLHDTRTTVILNARALPTEKKIESGTSQSRNETSVNLSKSGFQAIYWARTSIYHAIKSIYRTSTSSDHTRGTWYHRTGVPSHRFSPFGTKHRTRTPIATVSTSIYRIRASTHYSDS